MGGGARTYFGGGVCPDHIKYRAYYKTHRANKTGPQCLKIGPNIKPFRIKHRSTIEIETVIQQRTKTIVYLPMITNRLPCRFQGGGGACGIQLPPKRASLPRSIPTLPVRQYLKVLTPSGTVYTLWTYTYHILHYRGGEFDID